MGGEYVPFEGICLTDTFQMYESDDLISHYMPDNSERRKRQKATDIQVIVGNPPYSAGQTSANDNNANVAYPTLDGRIRETYAVNSKSTLQKSLYDSYIRAIRWGSDQLEKAGSGVMAYVSNAGWIDGNSADGLRKSLAEEFSNLYVFHLRGNQRTSGEVSRREGGKIFGAGSRAPIAIVVMVKKPGVAERGNIFFHDIGDYLSQQEKLKLVRDFGSIGGIEKAGGWTHVIPDQHHDWTAQRDGSFDAYIRVGDKKDKLAERIFETYTLGIASNRDAWCYNSSRSLLEHNIDAMINFYNQEAERAKGKPSDVTLGSFLNNDPTKISWTANLKSSAEKHQKLDVTCGEYVQSVYRPFSKQWLFFSRKLNERVGQIPQMFPTSDSKNRMIMIKQRWAGDGHLALMVDEIVELQTDGGAQSFPLKLYGTSAEAEDSDLFAAATNEDGYAVRDGITDAGLKHFLVAYPGETITKEDLSYYVYGLLHSEDYRAKYADNLSKELPRIPRVKTAADFWAFSRAGRELGDLHVNYETVEPYPVTIKQGDMRLADIKNPEAFYRVTKWAFGKAGKEKDKTTVIYNANITMQDVPLEAYDYVVNGKPALEWVMERQVVKVDKDSGIENDANRYAVETVGNPAYPLELFQRVITVSLRTMEIVRGLPKLEVM